MAWVEWIAAASLAAILARLVMGPTPWDRLLAVNSASTRIVLLMALAAVALDEPAYLDVAVVYAALSFLGVVILARTMERTGGGV